jgi:hypothetical protein
MMFMKPFMSLILFFSPILLMGQQYSSQSKVLLYQGRKEGRPRIQLSSPNPESDQYVNGIFNLTDSLVTISGWVEEDEGIDKVTINGRRLQLRDKNQFSFSRELAVGDLFNARITAVDKTGRASSYELFLKRVKKEKRLALVIGNSDYAHVPDLKNPVNDAKAMAALLRSLNFEVLEFYDLTYDGLRTALRTFSFKVEEADVTWIYYAGHAFQYDEINYLMPVDAEGNERGDPGLENISLNVILRTIERNADKGLNFIILDACRNDPRGGRFRGSDGGLAMIKDAPSGTLIAYATAPGAYADDGTGEHGLYTGELLKQMDISQPIEEVFKNTRTAVIRQSDREQVPWELSSLTGKAFRLK